MLRYYYINKEWILSPVARRIYRIAAVLSLLLFFGLCALKFGVVIPPNLFPIVRLCLFAGVVGAATTMVAMEYFLFGFDTSSAWRRAVWFLIMFFPPLGPAIYCLIVYSRSTAIKASMDRAGTH